MKVAIKRAYEPASSKDGTRILVDRLWPRGVSKTTAQIDHWLKEVAPSTELRKWFGHDPAKWKLFCEKYEAELQGNPAFAELQSLVKSGPVTLVFAAHDEAHNNAVALKELLGRNA